MKTVLVTGSDGFIGRNLCDRLERQKDVTVLRFNRYNTLAELAELAAKTDFVFHLAAVMRPKDEADFTKVNQDLTKNLLRLLVKSQRHTALLITSSVHADRDNSYGKSKKVAEDLVREWGKNTGNPVYIYRLTNVFGKWSKPNYSSVVATFCYNITHDIDINIHDPATSMTLVYIDDVVQQFIRCLEGAITASPDTFCTIPRQFNCTLQELADTLYHFHDDRPTQTPELRDTFERFLYDTYTSFEDPPAVTDTRRR